MSGAKGPYGGEERVYVRLALPEAEWEALRAAAVASDGTPMSEYARQAVADAIGRGFRAVRPERRRRPASAPEPEKPKRPRGRPPKRK
jgi:hypothetical protein